MAKVRYYDVNKRERWAIIGELYEIISSLKSKDEAFSFLFGLLTPSEVLMVARRIQIAIMLLEEMNYDEIGKELGVSKNTISRVEHWLKSDENRRVLIEQKIKELVKKRETRTKNSRNLLDRYPQHRFLKELFGM